MEENKTEFGKRYDELINSDQYRIAMRYDKLSIIWSYCEANKLELERTIQISSTEENALELMDQNNKKVFKQYMNEFIRTFLNHIGSNYIFIEYTRRENKYLNNLGKHITGYSTKIDQLFKENELIQFVNCLRNYCIHVALPNFGYTFSFSTTEESKQYLYIMKNDLLNDNSWNKKAFNYINGCDDEIIIEPLINQYFQIQKDFYKWFNQEYYTICQTEIQFVNETLKELFRK